MKKLLIMISAATCFAATLNATEINLRDWLTAKGVTVADCVSGEGHNSNFGPQRLFDGKGLGTKDTANFRWLAMEKTNYTASAKIEIPKATLAVAKKDLIVKKVRLWRNINDDAGVERAPTTWKFSGSNDGEHWTTLQKQDTAVTWDKSMTSREIELPDNCEAYRFLKFQPLSSNYAWEWKVGLQEIEYFVEEVPAKPGVNIREWLTEKGATVAECVSGTGHLTDYGPTVLFDGVNSVETYETARANRWLVNEKYGTTTGYATIAASDSLFDSDMGGLVLTHYRVYKYSSLSGDNMDAHRAPASWVIYGSNDGETWDVVHDQSEVAQWREPGKGLRDYVEYDVPESGRLPYRRFMFKPVKSLYGAYAAESWTWTWQEGAMELELFVEESAPVANLRDYLTDKGVTVASCVSGEGHNSSFGPERLFDGQGKGTKNTALYRWLAGNTNATAASVTVKIPESVLASAKKGLVLKRICLWRNINDDAGVERAPTTWKFSGSNDGEHWTTLQKQDTAVTWDKSMTSREIELPDNCEVYRFLKFQPLSSNYAWEWKVGLQELEYFVSEVPLDTVVVRGSLGDNVGSSYPAYGRVEGLSSGDSLTVTATTPSYADGVKYEATGYTLETSADGGITWGAATSHSGTSATITYDGTPTRIIWQWSPIAYRLDAHADEGNETVTVSPASSDGYYAAGTALTVTAAGATSPTVTTFKEWDVQPEGAVADGATISFTMPATPTEVNAAFTRPWTYIAQGNISGYPDYKIYAAVTDGNWLFVVASRTDNAVSAEQYFCLNAYVEGSGRLDLTTLYTDLETQGARQYPLRGVNASAMNKAPEFLRAWKDGRSDVTSVVVPADIWDVEGNAFSACANLKSVELGGTLEKWNILTSGTATAGAFRNCPALTNVTLHGATTLPHHIFAGSAPEVVFDGVPPTTVGTAWADDWSLAVGCPRRELAAWRIDSRFTALAAIEDVSSKPNYAAMVERYGKDLVGTWDGKWLFRYGTPLGLVIILK